MKREILAAAIAAMFAGGAVAQQSADSQTLATQSAQMDSLSTSQGNLKVESRISSDFNAFAGSTANSSSLVSGLRNGSAITLTSADPKGVITETTFTPPTGKMGYGNVYTSLALAKQQLANVGITQPTAEQLQASLMGGNVTVINPNGTQTTTLMKGVLALRSEGMGWGQIAQAYGTKLGPVISGMKSANAHISSPTTAAGTTATTGVTSASGAKATGVTTAAGGSSHGQGNAYGRGITTGAGGAAGQGHGNAYGRGITTGAGGTPGNSGNAGQAKGVGKGG